MTKLKWIKARFGKRCMACACCVAVCPANALKIINPDTKENLNKFGRPKLNEKFKIEWDEKKCTRCMLCIKSCPEEVLEFK